MVVITNTPTVNQYLIIIISVEALPTLFYFPTLQIKRAPHKTSLLLTTQCKHLPACMILIPCFSSLRKEFKKAWEVEKLKAGSAVLSLMRLGLNEFLAIKVSSLLLRLRIYTGRLFQRPPKSLSKRRSLWEKMLSKNSLRTKDYNLSLHQPWVKPATLQRWGTTARSDKLVFISQSIQLSGSKQSFRKPTLIRTWRDFSKKRTPMIKSNSPISWQLEIKISWTTLPNLTLMKQHQLESL